MARSTVTGNLSRGYAAEVFSKFLAISSRLSVSYSTRGPVLHPPVAIDGPAESAIPRGAKREEEPLNIDALPCDLMVNGVPFRAVQIRNVPL